MLKRRFLWGLLIVELSLQLCQPAFSQHSRQVYCTAEFSTEQLWFQKVKGYDLVGLNGAAWLADSGKPMLPSKEVKIPLPHGMKAEGLQVEESAFDLVPGRFLILPTQPPVRTGVIWADEDFVQPEPATYSANRPYPPGPADFTGQADLAGQGFAVVQLYPLQYVPAERRLRLYKSITLSIEGTSGHECGDYLPARISERCRRTYERMARGLAEDPHGVQLTSAARLNTSMLPPSGPIDHVIITSSSLASDFQPLVEWHTQKGVKDTVITTAWIYSNYSGADSQKIRSFVADANSSWGTIYFLLGGEDPAIPMAYRYYYLDPASSDQYYSDYDDDGIHEVFVGRVPVENAAEINTFINKVLKYEKDPPRTSYPLDILLVGMDLDMTTCTELLKESIDTLIPARFNVTRVYDSHVGHHERIAVSALNSGQNLINHAGHGAVDIMGMGLYWHGWGLDQPEVNTLTNSGQTSVIVSLACHLNHMDHEECIAETFVLVNAERAGVAFTGNTRSGYTYGGNPSSLSGTLDREWWVSLFNRDRYNLGELLAEAKHHFGISSPDADVKRHCEWIFNLLGEPEMPIWTAEPDSFEVTCSLESAAATSSFAIEVRDATNHTPVDQALVCLWKRGEVYLTGYTDPAGGITFDPRPSTDGSMHVTVTKYNYIPHEQEVEVSGCFPGDANGDGIVDVADVVYLVNFLYRNGDPPAPMEAGDANCDGIVNVGDVIYLVNYLYKDGPPPSCPIGTLIGYEGCLELGKGGPTDSIPPDQDCMVYQYDGEGIVLLRHVNTGFNCCPGELLADITIQDNVIIIEEDESLDSG
jgi:hypothetical protein